MELELERMRMNSGAGSDGDDLPSSEGKGGRFRLMAGGHIDPQGREYKSGQIVTASNDLALKFGPDKFQRLSVIHETGGDEKAGSKETKLGREEILKSQKKAEDARRKVNDDERVRRELGDSGDGLSQVEGHGVNAGSGPNVQQDEETARNTDPRDPSSLPAGVEPDDETEDDDTDSGGSGDADDSEGYENLDEMSVAELKEMAEAEEIDLHGATRKADIVAKIKASKKK
jgi:hypothetical protein